MQDPQAWNPGSVQWGDAGADGVARVVLEGDARTAGAPFSYAARVSAGSWSAPHSHSQDLRLFVASGMLRLGYGTDFEKERAVAYPAGSFLFVPAGMRHFDGAEEETVLFVASVGVVQTAPA